MNQGFTRYVETAPIAAAIIPGLGQLMLLHGSAPVWFVGAILADLYTDIGWAVHAASFLHAALIARNVLRTNARLSLR
jgi:hypothetical protein